jgi:PD-(D/E)XK nuclease superfamily
VIYSYSFFSDLENCPRKAQHKYVLKDVEKGDSDALILGRVTHERMENRLKGLTPTAYEYEPYAVALDPHTKHVEVALAITTNEKGCGFWDKAAWFRGKVDVAVTQDDKCLIIDWKTGKPRENPLELELFSTLIWRNNTDLRHFEGRYVWLKDMRVGKAHALDPIAGLNYVKRRDVEVQALLRRGGEWPANSGPLCGYCPVKTCEHWRER